MQKISINGLTLHYQAEHQATVELVQHACQKCSQLLYEHWGLEPPKDCHVYIMTSWLGFMFQAPPWPWKILLVLTLPLWAFRVRKLWPLAGGWEQRFGQRRAVGVKPPRLLHLGERTLGDRFFIRWDNIGEQFQSITCHELTHAFTAHLPLPTWLKEGLAMVMVDRCLEKETVQYESLALLANVPDRHISEERQHLNVEDEDALVHLYVRSYWLTRYIEETRPGLLSDLLSGSSLQNEYDRKIATAYEQNPTEFWGVIDEILVAHFNYKNQAA